MSQPLVRLLLGRKGRKSASNFECRPDNFPQWLEEVISITLPAVAPAHAESWSVCRRPADVPQAFELSQRSWQIDH